MALAGRYRAGQRPSFMAYASTDGCATKRTARPGGGDEGGFVAFQAAHLAAPRPYPEPRPLLYRANLSFRKRLSPIGRTRLVAGHGYECRGRMRPQRGQRDRCRESIRPRTKRQLRVQLRRLLQNHRVFVGPDPEPKSVQPRLDDRVRLLAEVRRSPFGAHGTIVLQSGPVPRPWPRA